MLRGKAKYGPIGKKKKKELKYQLMYVHTPKQNTQNLINGRQPIDSLKEQNQEEEKAVKKSNILKKFLCLLDS